MLSVPKVPFVLGLAGAIPFLLCAVLVWSESTEFFAGAVQASLLYGALILSFLGGVQWGLQLKQIDKAPSILSGYSLSILPTLVAFSTVYMHNLTALITLVTGFLGSLLYDLKRVRDGAAPEWYAKLRYLLSGVVILCLLSVLFAVALKT